MKWDEPGGGQGEQDLVIGTSETSGHPDIGEIDKTSPLMNTDNTDRNMGKNE